MADWSSKEGIAVAIYPKKSGKVEYDFDISQLAAENILPLKAIADTLNDKLRRVMSVEAPLKLEVDLTPVAGDSGYQKGWKVTLTVIRKDSGEMWDHKSHQLINEFKAAANEALGLELFTRD